MSCHVYVKIPNALEHINYGPSFKQYEAMVAAFRRAVTTAACGCDQQQTRSAADQSAATEKYRKTTQMDVFRKASLAPLTGIRVLANLSIVVSHAVLLFAFAVGSSAWCESSSTLTKQYKTAGAGANALSAGCGKGISIRLGSGSVRV